jgi:hypothetical protein
MCCYRLLEEVWVDLKASKLTEITDPPNWTPKILAGIDRMDGMFFVFRQNTVQDMIRFLQQVVTKFFVNNKVQDMVRFNK